MTSYDPYEGDRDLDSFKGEDWRGRVFQGKYDNRYDGGYNSGGGNYSNENDDSDDYSYDDSKRSKGKIAAGSILVLFVIGIIFGISYGIIDINNIEGILGSVVEAAQLVEPKETILQQKATKLYEIDSCTLRSDLIERVLIDCGNTKAEFFSSVPIKSSIANDATLTAYDTHYSVSFSTPKGMKSYDLEIISGYISPPTQKPPETKTESQFSLEKVEPVPNYEKNEPVITFETTSKQTITQILTGGQYNISYKISDIPSVPDKKMVERAVHRSISAWNTLNPDLRFIPSQSDDANLIFVWEKVAPETHLGMASLGTFYRNNIEIALGTFDCNRNYVQHDENMLMNTMMHEIGHAFGIEHHPDENHLMYGTDLLSTNFDDKGYNIPKQLAESFVGQKQIENNIDSLEKEIDSLVQEIDSLAEKRDELLLLYEANLGSLGAERYYNNYYAANEQRNNLIYELDDLNEELNALYIELDCSPGMNVIFN